MNTSAYHNLCTTLTPPPGVSTVLGLGLKFCIKSLAPHKTSLDDAFDRFRHDIRLKYFFADDKEIPRAFNPQLYIKSDWSPPRACTSIEKRISDFQKDLSFIRSDILKNTRPSSNLTKSQLCLLQLLHNNPDFIVLDTDKNLGPSIMERRDYTTYMLDQHLLKGNNYSDLTQQEAMKVMAEFTDELAEIVNFDHVNDLTDKEVTFFFKRV